MGKRATPWVCQAGMAQWWEHSSPTKVARVRFPDLESHVRWACWFSTLLCFEIFFSRYCSDFPLSSKTNLQFNTSGFDLIMYQRRYPWRHLLSLGSLSTRVFETRTATGRERFACQASGVSQIFVEIISNVEKILSNMNVVVWRQVKRENSSLPVAVRVAKTRVLKLSFTDFKICDGDVDENVTSK